MKRAIWILLAMLGTIQVYAQDKSRDSTYSNWYYDGREKLYQTLKGKRYDVVFFGNSITERGPWQELIGRKYKVGNRGIGGDNTFGMKARIADAMKSRPKKIFLMMGINDIGRGLPAEWSLKNYEEIIRIIRNTSPKTKIYVQSTLPLHESVLKYDYLLGKEHLIRILNRGIEDLAQKYNLVYVNIKEALADDYVLKEEYTMDGIHVNTDAYICWVNYLKEKKYL
ncbi:GDSL family lipase [Parapusillimonas sp. SGNA-6]|uniref:GDSL-type esterase/lipase family protein n=1 Tax=Parapedobacter sp. SGR-10 TaxID=2710879 RepID=UPI0013D6318D|nr:GDSL-type esterase/lipase family protein [Parapedobacter sp. SGR-10]NGF55221.1 GDSL family lipase [Parapedobacter sp. SGR-10]NGM89159.1 GDSL family lipase [Parapusillimonas sp. SGNA-6]